MWGAYKKTAERRPNHYRISIREAVHLVSEIAPEQAEKLAAISFNTQQDSIVWNWNSVKIYSSKSLYKVLKGGGRTRWRFLNIWQFRVTPTVRIFGYLLLNDKLLTHANMETRNMHCDPRCVMWDDCPTEMTVHLMFQCRFAKEVWFRLGQMAAISFPDVITEGLEIDAMWEFFTSRIRGNGSKLRELVLCACWHI